MMLLLLIRTFAINDKQQHVLLMGTSCAGKTSVANAFAQSHPVEVFQVDEYKKALMQLEYTQDGREFAREMENFARRNKDLQYQKEEEVKRIESQQSITV